MKNMIQDQNAVTALIGGTLIDGTGKPPVKDSTIILQGNIIKKVLRILFNIIIGVFLFYTIAGFIILPLSAKLPKIPGE